MLSSLCLPLPSLSLSNWFLSRFIRSYRSTRATVPSDRFVSPRHFGISFHQSHFKRILWKNNRAVQEKQNISSFVLSSYSFKDSQFRYFLIFSSYSPDSFFLVQTIITTTLAPRGAGVGLLSLRRARFTRRDHMFSPSPSRARADRLSRPVSSLSSRRASLAINDRKRCRRPRTRCIYWTDFVLRRRARSSPSFILATCHPPLFLVHSSSYYSPRVLLTLFSRVFLISSHVGLFLSAPTRFYIFGTFRRARVRYVATRPCKFNPPSLSTI